MMPPERKHLWMSVLRQTGRSSALVGYWLRRHRRTEQLQPAQLARKLRVRMEGLVLLSLCRAPREDHFREDLEVICCRTGADEVTLAGILRQEQALARWAEARPDPEGWLMAASDAEAAPTEETGPGADPDSESPHDPGPDRPAGG
jgi:hypothetical protein